MLRSTDLGQLRPTGINGLLGLDELSRFEYAIIDFKGATLALGPRRHQACAVRLLSSSNVGLKPESCDPAPEHRFAA